MSENHIEWLLDKWKVLVCVGSLLIWGGTLEYRVRVCSEHQDDVYKIESRLSRTEARVEIWERRIEHMLGHRNLKNP